MKIHKDEALATKNHISQSLQMNKKTLPLRGVKLNEACYEESKAQRHICSPI